jgi:hypothetical protein
MDRCSLACHLHFSAAAATVFQQQQQQQQQQQHQQQKEQLSAAADPVLSRFTVQHQDFLSFQHKLM